MPFSIVFIFSGLIHYIYCSKLISTIIQHVQIILLYNLIVATIVIIIAVTIIVVVIIIIIIIYIIKIFIIIIFVLIILFTYFT